MASGFEWKYNVGGSRALVHPIVMATTETLTKGDMLNIQSGEVDLAVTTDASIIGIFLGPESPSDAVDGKPGTVAGTGGTTLVKVIVNPDAVYEDKDDNNARLIGATLDISGATGAQALAATSNTEFVVVERKRQNADPTRFSIIGDNHPFTKAQ